MNFVEVTLGLNPILGLNVTKLVLEYMTVFDNDTKTKKYSLKSERIYTHLVCEKYNMNNYNLGIFMTDIVYEMFENIWNNFDICGKRWIKNIGSYKNCKVIHCKCISCEIIVTNFMASEKNPLWSHFINIDDFRRAFCLDIGEKYEKNDLSEIKETYDIVSLLDKFHSLDVKYTTMV